MNVLVFLQIAQAVAVKGNVMQTLSDLEMLYSLYAGIKGGSPLDLAAMTKAGTLKPTIDALTRMTAIVDGLLSDPAQAPRITALLTGLAG